MAASIRRSTRSVERLLFEEPHRFDFYKAVQILEQLHPETIPVGESAEPDREPVRFSSDPSLAFPPSDLKTLKGSGTEKDQPTLTVTFLGLAGVHGPLPNTVTEVILQRQHKRDRAFRSFLDIFNHRLLSLLYRVRRQTRLPLRHEPPEKTHYARYLMAFLGLGTPYLRDRMGLQDRGLLPYVGLLAGRARSAPGLETLLSDYFDIPVTIKPFIGRWLDLAEDDRTTLGLRLGANNALGVSTVVGRRVWDRQSTFLLVLGPLTLDRFRTLLPVGSAFGPATALTRFYVGEHLDFDFHLVLRPEEVPQARLGRADGSYLGWTSWLKRTPGSREAGRVRLSARRYSTTTAHP